MTFPGAVKEVLPPDDRIRVSRIVSVNPLKIDVQGTQVPAGSLASYAPVFGDNVAVVRQDGTWLVLGLTVPSTAGGSGGDTMYQAGSVSMTVTAALSATTAVTFARPYVSTPSVTTNINDGSGSTSGWGSRAYGITTTGFTLFIFGSSSTFTVPVLWQAQGLTQ